MSNVANESSGLQSCMMYLTSKSSRILRVNSDYYSDIIYYFTGSISISDGFIFMASLHDFICPITWYTISAYNDNNTLNYQINSVQYTYTIPDGNYSANDLIDLFNSTDLFNNNSIYTSYDIITNKFIFTNQNSDNFTFLYTSTCFELLGFTTDIDHDSTDFELFSDKQVDLAGTREIYIVTSLTCLNLDSRTGSLSSNILSKIPVTGNSGNFIYYTNSTNFRTIVRDRTINKIEIRLENDKGELLPLTEHYSCSIDFHVIPDKYLLYTNSLTN